MQPQSPNHDFDFMLKDQAQAKRSLGLPELSKPIKIIIAVVAGFILIIVISSLLSGRKSGAYQPIVDSMARGQEILRVTEEVQQLNLNDSGSQALAATVDSQLTSDLQQLKSYLAGNNDKVSTLQLAADTDKSTDSQMQSASQNNNIDQTYVTYLQDNLAKYQTDLQTAYKSAGPKGKTILQSAFDGVNSLLSTPPLKS